MKIWRQRFFVLAFLLGLGAALSTTLIAQDDGDAWSKKQSAWLLLAPAERPQVQDFSEEYK
ncbi:MAG: hypothetical protein ACYDHE_13260, partial [Candidatus Acidiferrales bacterium]